MKKQTPMGVVFKTVKKLLPELGEPNAIGRGYSEGYNVYPGKERARSIMWFKETNGSFPVRWKRGNQPEQVANNEKDFIHQLTDHFGHPRTKELLYKHFNVNQSQNT